VIDRMEHGAGPRAEVVLNSPGSKPLRPVFVVQLRLHSPKQARVGRADEAGIPPDRPFSDRQGRAPQPAIDTAVAPPCRRGHTRRVSRCSDRHARLISLMMLPAILAGCTPYIPVKDDFATSALAPAGDSRPSSPSSTPMTRASIPCWRPSSAHLVPADRGEGSRRVDRSTGPGPRPLSDPHPAVRTVIAERFKRAPPFASPSSPRSANSWSK